MKMIWVSALAVLAGCGKPFWQAPAPKPEPEFPGRLLNAPIDSISLYQSSAMVQSKEFEYVLRSDGTAAYCVLRYAPVLGRYTAQLDRAAYERLELLLRNKHFLQMARSYEYPATDQMSTVTQAFLADTVKVVHRYGEPEDTPPALREIEQAVSQVAGGLHWLYAGPAAEPCSEIEPEFRRTRGH
jgi:uncharacterized protein DUF6438